MKELNIGKCIIQERKERKITQQQLADYIGVSKASVSKWESGLSNSKGYGKTNSCLSCLQKEYTTEYYYAKKSIS